MSSLFGIIAAIIAHILNGSVSVIDKFLLAKTFRQPAAYAFWIGLLSLGTFILLPFGFALPSGLQWFLDLAAGATFVLALYFFYIALLAEETSRVVPVIGSLIPIFTLFLAYIFLNERLTSIQILAISILILGIILLTLRRSKVPVNLKFLFAAPIAALFFAISSVLMKEVFETQPFFAGLAWSRLGGVFIALLFLVWSKNRQAIFEKQEGLSGFKTVLFLVARLFSAFGFILFNLAISLISPTIVNALQGFQYAFLFGLILLLTKFWPQIIKEPLTRSTLVAKSLGILSIIIGSLILSL